MEAAGNIESIKSLFRQRRFVRVSVVVSLLGAFLVGGAAFLLPSQYTVNSSVWGIVFGAMWISLLIGGTVLRFARCPRCAKRYAVNAQSGTWNDFTIECLNCGLKLDGSNAAEL